MENIHWTVDPNSGAIVKGTYEDDLSFEIYLRLDNYAEGYPPFNVIVMRNGVDKAGDSFYSYTDALDYIDIVCQGAII